MPTAAKLTCDLSAEQASYIESLVRSGTYDSESEVISAGLEALQDRDADVQRWLREEVGPAYDAVQADPSRLIPADQVLAELRARHSRRHEDPET